MSAEAISKVLEVWDTKNKILKPVKKEIHLELIEHMAHLFAAGSFYYYIFDFTNLEMDLVHTETKSVLGIDPDEFTLEKLLDIMHPEDITKLHEKESVATDFLLNKINKQDIPLYKVVYLMRLKHANGEYKTILHQVKTLVVSEGGKIQKVLGIHTDVTYLNIPIDHKISLIGHKRTSFQSIGETKNLTEMESECKRYLSKREMEIIIKLSLGKNFKQIASELHISPHTINTHKRNILKKLKCRNTTELVARCIREGVI